MSTETYYGPRTIAECEDDIETYTRRITERPASASRYQGHLDEAKKNMGLLRDGKVFDFSTQTFK